MSLQFVLGAAGAGKSHFIYNKIIEESVNCPDTNYILLVPEQYSMLLQRKMVMLHPYGGTMNIDVIGFNRLAYRIFDEQSVRTAKVLEDFGKSMLIRQVAGSVKDKLCIYGNSLDKPGFIDEVKSLMSELYQYNLGHGKIEGIIKKLEERNEENTLLGKKIADMSVIFNEFSKKINDEYIIAEEITELLAHYVEGSKLIKNSVIVMDGFTGFTPIQLNVVEKLIAASKKVYGVFTIDRACYEKKKVREHELFYLTRRTVSALKERAVKCSVEICDDIFIDGSGYGKNAELCWLEKNLFRYPYKKYEAAPENINISHYVNQREEIAGAAKIIRSLVVKEGYRYKDFAIITGKLEELEELIRHIMPMYDIPFFMDYSRPVKNNPYVDAICHMLRAVRENFSYDAVFSFLKSGVISDIENDDIEKLENYVILHGIKGLWRWQKRWATETDFVRKYVLELTAPFIGENGRLIKKATINEFADMILLFMEKLDYENKLSMEAEALIEKDNVEMSKLYGLLYGKICELLEKMRQIMGHDEVDIRDFEELFLLGIKDLSLGIIPTCLDMVTVGDITRTRLDGVKVLFVMNANDGVLSSKTSSTQIINDREKEKLFDMGFELADTEKQNAYVEQFYLYTNMTKPSDRLYISYLSVDNENKSLRPSYVIGRICNIFPCVKVNSGLENLSPSGTRKSCRSELIQGLKRLMMGDTVGSDEIYGLYRLYLDMGEEDFLKTVREGITYNNLPQNLSDDVKQLIAVKLMSVSVSRLEQYASCEYEYFLKYVVGLSERTVKKMDDQNIGILMHSVMERLYRHVHDNLENDWKRLTVEETDSLVERFVEAAFEAEEAVCDGRLLYIKSVIKRIGKRTAESLSKFTDDMLKPEYFEYKFKKNIGKEITLTGIVDRSDIYYSPDENKLKLRIIDYKSGNYDFSISKLYEGLQLQLAVYMSVMMELVSESYNRGRKVEVVPDGMFYFRMYDPFVDVADEDDEKIKAQRDKKLGLKGISDNPDYIRNVTDFAMKKTRELSDSVLEGKIEKNPVYAHEKTACTYCPYKDVCRFDDKNGGNKFRYTKYKEEDSELVYKKICEELGVLGDAVD